MNRKLIINDIKSSKLISTTIILFIFLASLLLSTGAGLISSLVSSMNNMFELAKTPHFMQMHSGEVDETRLKKFVEDHGDIESFQHSKFLYIDGSNINLNGDSLASSVQDNGLTTQNDHFDFLLDLNSNLIDAAPGELYVPLYYMKEMKLSVGDKARIANRDFTIAGFVRDSQMNAALVSSKRFVVHDQDFQALSKQGSIESLIEFRLFDPSQSTELESAYIRSGMESNGPPAITHRIFKVINLITDGLFISLLILISLFIVGIAILCVRFTVLAKIEEEYKEIGILKAIGLTSKEIGRIYLSKYIFLAGIASGLGYLFSFLLKIPFIQKIELAMGKGNAQVLGTLLGALGAIFVFLIVLLYMRSVLKKFKSISPAQALRFGTSSQNKKLKKSSFPPVDLLNVNSFIGMKELISDKKTYLTMAMVFILSIFLVMVPLNMYNTIEDRSFMRYLGVGDYDLRIDLSQMENTEEKAKEVLEIIKKDHRVSDTNLLISRMQDAQLESGKTEKIKVEIGDHQKFKVNYVEGQPPLQEDEIALSSMIAKDLDIGYGSRLTLLVGDERKQMKVCGIYSDITNGGKTAKASFEIHHGKVLWGVVSIHLKDNINSKELLEEYKNKFPFAKVSDTREYIHQVFGSTISSVGNVANISILATLILVFTLTLLFMRMLYFKNRTEVALLKALGFKDRDVLKQYLIKANLVLIFSIIIGTILTNTLGEMLSSQLLSLFGAEGIKFHSNLLMSFILVPLALLLVVTLATTLSQRGLSKLKISRLIKE